MARCAECGATLPADARFCPSCAAPVLGAPPPADERKVATVLFADLVGSTELAGSQDPERTRAVLDRFYDAMADEVARAGGTVEKFVGDAVVAAFGAPQALEDHAERALHTAISMRRRLQAHFGDALALRIGVNTGEVVVGRARAGSSFVSGDAVNVAARLEQAAAPNEVLAGERTVAAARGAFEFGDARSVEAKGKPRGVPARPLLRALTLMRPRGVGGLRRAFVGRDRELDLLLATYRRAVERGEPHVVTIMGDAGVGKTRLVRELWALLGEETTEPLRRTGRCLSYGHGITYWPLAEVLKEHLGITESDPPHRVKERLGEREILGLTLGLDVATGVHPLAARTRLHDAWVALLAELATERPPVVLIEDLHWAEPDLLDLLERLARDVRGPLVLIGTARPELLDSRRGWGSSGRNSSLVWLEPLGTADTAQMLETLLAAELPHALRAAIVERAEGNPFFVEELLSTLIDRGVIEREDGRWSVRDGSMEVEVPDSVQAVLAARMDMLPSAEKAGLQAAAVIGRVFWRGPVRHLLGGVEPDFRLLEDRDFVRSRPGSSIEGEDEFAFKHALTREVAYAGLPKARRARLHAEFAEWLEGFGEGRDELAALLGHHYAEAARPEDADLAWTGDEGEESLRRLRRRAVSWLQRAADLAVGRYEIGEGLALLHRAIALDPDEETRSKLWRSVGLANALVFDGEAFMTAMQNSLDLCFDRSTCADTYAELALQTARRQGMWRKRPPRELIESWIEHALDMGEQESATRAKALIARAFIASDDGLDAAREASGLAERLGDLNLRAQAWTARVMTAFRRRDYEEALTWSQRQLDIVGELTDPDIAADVYETAIPSCCATGRLREAARLAREHERLVEPLSSHHRLHGVAWNVEVADVRGRWDEIRASAARVREAVDENLATPCIRNSRSLLLSAVAFEIAGDEKTAAEFERRAEEVGQEGYEDVLAAPRTRLALVRGDLDAAARLLPRLGGHGGIWFHLSHVATRLDALAALGDRERLEQEAPELGRPRTYLEPFALRALGLVREDDELLGRAIERFDAFDLDWHAERTRALL